MNESFLNKKGRTILLVSVAANIFLVAFLLGRVAPHDRGRNPHDGDGGPPLMHDAGGPHADGARMPPPVFGPNDLFGPDEMQADESRLRDNFQKMDTLRKAFAAQLQKGAVSKDDVLKHFASVDEVMGNVRKEAQTRAADKISAMSEEARTRFAQTLLSRDQVPPAPPQLPPDFDRDSMKR